MCSFTNFPTRGSRVVAWGWWAGSASTCWSVMCRPCPVSHLPSLCILSNSLHLDVLTPLMNIKLRLALWGSLTAYGDLDLSSSPGGNRWSSVHNALVLDCWSLTAPYWWRGHTTNEEENNLYQERLAGGSFINLISSCSFCCFSYNYSYYNITFLLLECSSKKCHSGSSQWVWFWSKFYSVPTKMVQIAVKVTKSLNAGFIFHVQI